MLDRVLNMPLEHILDHWPKFVINPFQVNVLSLYPLKTSGNLLFSDLFRTLGNWSLAWDRVNENSEKLYFVSVLEKIARAFGKRCFVKNFEKISFCLYFLFLCLINVRWLCEFFKNVIRKCKSSQKLI